MHCFSPCRRLLAGLVLSSGAALAQPQAAPPAPAQAPAWQSAFEGYRPFADEPVASWGESNATVGRNGGWRVYAREAQAPAAAPAPAGPAAPAPAQPAARPAAPAAGGHSH